MALTIILVFITGVFEIKYALNPSLQKNVKTIFIVVGTMTIALSILLAVLCGYPPSEYQMIK